MIRCQHAGCSRPAVYRIPKATATGEAYCTCKAHAPAWIAGDTSLRDRLAAATGRNLAPLKYERLEQE